MSTAPTGLALYLLAGGPYRLIRLDFRDGVAAGRAEVPLVDPGSLSGGPVGIHRGRAFYTGAGVVIDLATGQTIVPWRGELREADGGRLIMRRGDRDGKQIFTIDLDTFAEAELPPPTVWHLPGIRSPGRTRTVATRSHTFSVPLGELWVHEPGRPVRRLASGCHATLARQDIPSQGVAPCIWVDETRVLTQRDNGELILVGLGGDVEATIRVPLDEEHARPPHGPGLWGDRDGSIVYCCGGCFRINPVDREVGPYLWEPLGFGFHEEAKVIGRLRYGGEEIGRRERIGRAEVCRGHLAQRAGDGGLAVWSAAGWQHIDVQFFDLIGWVDRREEMI